MPHTTPPTHGTESQNKQPNQTLGLTFNWEDWLPHFEDADIPDKQKREMIETLWHIVVAFVDLGFELNPNQKPPNAGGKQSCGQSIDLKAVLEEAVLKSEMAERTLTHLNKPKP